MSLHIKEVQIISSIRYYSTPTRKAKIFLKLTTSITNKNVEQLGLLCIIGGSVKWRYLCIPDIHFRWHWELREYLLFIYFLLKLGHDTICLFLPVPKYWFSTSPNFIDGIKSLVKT